MGLYCFRYGVIGVIGVRLVLLVLPDCVILVIY